MSTIEVRKLTVGDIAPAREVFRVMAEVFETRAEPLSDGYLTQLLGRGGFWAYGAWVNGHVAGGLTAHTIPLTRAEQAEILLYDIAVSPEYQRQGIGRRLVAALRGQAADAGVGVVFVPADNEDTHALDFYHALGGAAAPVTIFTFGE
ncbi:MAG: GNAT family N-acetyltransferase [Bryobacterales bacterium]|nr:GNAT family N-acetyltransferase [Bryobacterales bacterium]